MRVLFAKLQVISEKFLRVLRYRTWAIYTVYLLKIWYCIVYINRKTS